MAELIPLDPTIHREHGWQRHQTLAFSATDVCAPVVLAELKALIPFYALTFVRDGKSSESAPRYLLVCLLGLHRGENLALNSAGKWLLPYVPSLYRGYPFGLRWAQMRASDNSAADAPGPNGANDTASERRAVLCFDRSSGQYRELPDPQQGELRFFDDAGQPSELTRGVLNFLAQRQQNLLQTQHAVDALAEHGLLIPWDLGLQSPDPQRPLLGGFYRIDEQRLSTLEGPALEILLRCGALAAAHAQLLSMPRVAALSQLYQLRHRETQAAQILQNTEELFGSEDDTLKFNF